ncbi:MAG: hypothetical protein WC747_02070 [Candidatus Babeliales bacterium]|jgi:hypothetical protein
MKSLFKLYVFLGLSLSGLQLHGYGSNCQYYTDLFGPLQTGYTMGDLVRYTVTPGLNVYNKAVIAPAGAQDINDFGKNTYNLYNALGYLYAGWAALHHNDPTNTIPQYVSNVATIKKSWMTDYRTGNSSLQGFDNSNTCIPPIIFPMTESIGTPSIGGYSPAGGDSTSAFQNLGGLTTNYNYANASCGWCSNTDDGNYILAYWSTAANAPVILPTGQFFGARIAHILGAVVNDVPWSDDLSSSNASGGTGSFASPLLSGSKTTLPMLAVMAGNSAGYTNATAPAGMIEPSTAHFGSMQTFLSKKPILRNVSSAIQSYLETHINQTVTRLASVCSYGLDPEKNLIEINDNSVTAYDSGVIVAIQNNTGDPLTVNQIAPSVAGSSTGSATTPVTTVSTQIGSLTTGASNYYLHTASLMSPSTSATSVNLPASGNAIEIKDSVANSSVFIQVVTPGQLSVVTAKLNAAYGSKGGSLAYNQENAYTAPSNAQYLLITNFDTSGAITGSNYTMYRMQAVNLAEFNGQPYFVTLQINKEQLGYGLNGTQLDLGLANSSILYPSIVSVKTFLWQSVLDATKNTSTALNYYSYVPLLLMPDSIMKAGVDGLQAYYTIWLMSYAAALTEFMGISTFGDTLNCLYEVFDLFDASGIHQQPPARVVIDAANLLQSGQSLILSKDTINVQSIGQYLALMGSDVWDLGSNFHQDIPILNLYAGASQGEVVVNKTGGTYINFGVTVGSPKPIIPTTFADWYGVPYNNTMLFSLPAATLQAGVIATLSQPTPGNYQLAFTDQANNVLAVQKVFVDTAIQNISPITVDFLHADGDRAWSSPVVLPAKVVSVGVAQTQQFMLQYTSAGSKNTLTLPPMTFDLIKNKAALKKSVPNPSSYIWFDSTSYSGATYANVSSDQTIAELVLELEFSDGSSSSLHVDAQFPKEFALIAQHLGKQKSVSISSNVDTFGSAASFIAYDALTLKPLCKFTFKNLVASDGKTSISHRAVLTKLNVVYQTTDSLTLNMLSPVSSASYQPKQPIILQSTSPSGVQAFTISQGSQVEPISLTPVDTSGNPLTPVSVSSKDLVAINAAIVSGISVSVTFNSQDSADGSAVNMFYAAYDLTSGKKLCDNLSGTNISTMTESKLSTSTNIVAQGQTFTGYGYYSIRYDSKYPIAVQKVAAKVVTKQATKGKAIEKIIPTKVEKPSEKSKKPFVKGSKSSKPESKKLVSDEQYKAILADLEIMKIGASLKLVSQINTLEKNMKIKSKVNKLYTAYVDKEIEKINVALAAEAN